MNAIEFIALLDYYRARVGSGFTCKNQSHTDAEKYVKALEKMLKNRTEGILKTE